MSVPPYLSNPVLARHSPRVTHFFGTRGGVPVGSGELAVGVVGQKPPDYPRVIRVKQVHGAEVLVLDHPVPVGTELEGSWDALLTNQAEVLLAVGTADCVPVLLYDPHRRVIAAVHSGWRGTVQEIVPKTLHRMRECFGTHPKDVQMGIGPSAGVCCYEVDEAVWREFVNGDPVESCVVPSDHPGKGHLDLRACIRRQALGVGVPPEAIGLIEACTICRSDLFFSYRRDGHARNTMVSGIMLHDG